MVELMKLLVAVALMAVCSAESLGSNSSTGLDAGALGTKDWLVDQALHLPPPSSAVGPPAPRRTVPVDAPTLYLELQKLHNSYRAIHQADPLSWDSTLARETAAYVANCTWAHASGPFGENMYLTSSTTDFAGALVDSVTRWYNEVVNYNFTQPGFNTTTGHFTQVVWRSSARLGCAAAVCLNGIKGAPWPNGTLVICRYTPPGNVVGQFARNVFPPVPAPTNATLVPVGVPIKSPDCFASGNGKYHLCMRRDGRLMLLNRTADGDITLWSTDKVRLSAITYPLQASFTVDGNLEVTSAAGSTLWSSQTRGLGVEPRRLALQDDGNLVLYDANNVTLWQSKTVRRE